uniref:Uncharacterized protein n=1 Tax=Ascaris lumbricoides TaxID=6252 RepID=A0A0M3IXE8_ASCLU
MAQGDDGQTNPTTDQSNLFLSGTMAVKEETLTKTQQQQQNNLRDLSAISTELICERASEIAATSYANEGVSVEEVMAQGDDGQTNPTTD